MSKLTLSVDPGVVARAKKYAKQNGMTVSGMVEAYLAEVSERSMPVAKKPTPILDSLRGSLKKGSLEDYKKYLEAKYL